MPVLPLVLGWLILAAEPATPAPAGYRPTGSPAALHDLGLLARLRDPRVRTVEDDGSRWTGDDEGHRLLARADGPGIIQRIRLSGPSSTHGEVPDPGARIQIYLDGESRPALDLPLAVLSSGRHPHFPAPLVSSGQGGLVCLVPIAFRDGCRVVLKARDPRSSRVTLTRLPEGSEVAPFAESPDAATAADLRRAVALWSDPGGPVAIPPGAETAEFRVEGLARSTHLFLLPDGPRTVRSFEVIPDPDTADAWRSARLRLSWDGDDPDRPGVDLPAGVLFGQAFEVAPFATVLAGGDAAGWYGRFPMPYRRQALLKIDAGAPIKGVLRVRTTPGVEPNAGYFRAAVLSSRSSGSDFDWTDERGRGHAVGMVLTWAGRPGLPIGSWGVVESARPGTRGPRALALWDYVSGGLPVARDGSRMATGPLGGTLVPRQGGGPPRISSYCWRLDAPPPASCEGRAGMMEATDGPRSGEIAGDVRAAVFWYSERPGPGRAGP
jgi:hypothetical protein